MGLNECLGDRENVGNAGLSTQRAREENEKVVQQVWPGSYCYDSESYNKDRATRFKVTDGEGGRDCMDVAEGPSRNAAIKSAADKARRFLSQKSA